jgi:hypothetical protein
MIVVLLVHYTQNPENLRSSASRKIKKTRIFGGPHGGKFPGAGLGACFAPA